MCSVKTEQQTNAKEMSTSVEGYDWWALSANVVVYQKHHQLYSNDNCLILANANAQDFSMSGRISLTSCQVNTDR